MRHKKRRLFPAPVLRGAHHRGAGEAHGVGGRLGGSGVEIASAYMDGHDIAIGAPARILLMAGGATIDLAGCPGDGRAARRPREVEGARGFVHFDKLDPVAGGRKVRRQRKGQGAHR